MSTDDDGLRWDSVSYKKHVKATVRAWERSWARKWSCEPGSHAQYDPNLSREQIERIEMACARGKIGKPLEELSHSKSFYYTHVKIIGVSKGEFTKHIIVFRQNSGSVHGYPIPASELATKKRAAQERAAMKRTPPTKRKRKKP